LTLFLYLFSFVLSPFVRALTLHRARKGLEEKGRIKERYGAASLPRPKGPLVWIHAASVGETVSLVPLIKSYKSHYPDHTVLLTTTTVTAAMIAKQRLLNFCIHQYAPFDVGPWVARFLKHWKPSLVIFVESELWPGIVQQVHKKRIPLILLNGRLSDRSYHRWLRVRFLAKHVLSPFALCLAQSKDNADRFKRLGAPKVQVMANLKFAATSLPLSTKTLEDLSALFGGRPLWVAASTHPGEEDIVINVHKALQRKIPDLLTVLIPRHPGRAEKVAQLCEDQGLSVRRHSHSGTGRQSDFGVYLVDTIGELGVFFSLSSVVFVGGSFVPIGGHNPIEPSLFGCAVLWGPHMTNFRDVVSILKDACCTLETPKDLEKTVRDLLANPDKAKTLGMRALSIVKKQAEDIQTIVSTLRSFYE